MGGRLIRALCVGEGLVVVSGNYRLLVLVCGLTTLTRDCTPARERGHRWLARTAPLTLRFWVGRVPSASRDRARRLVADAGKTTASVVGRLGCGARERSKGSRRTRVRDRPVGGRPTVLGWSKRVWRCPEAAFPTKSWSEVSGCRIREHDLERPARRICECLPRWIHSPWGTQQTSVESPTKRTGRQGGDALATQSHRMPYRIMPYRIANAPPEPAGHS